MGAANYSIEQYLNIRSAYAPTFSPDGTRLAFLTNITGVPQVWSVAVDGGWPDQLTFATERVSALAYSPRSPRLAFTMDSGGNEREQIYLLSEDGSQVIALTDEPEVFHHLGRWSPDGRLLAFSSNGRQANFFDIYVQETTPPYDRRQVLVGENIHRPGPWSPDGRLLVVERQRGMFDNDLLLLDIASGEARHITPHEGEAYYGSVHFAPDGQGLYLVTSQGRDFQAPAYLDLASGQMQILADVPWDIELAALCPHGRHLAYTVNAGGWSQLVVQDLSAGTDVPLPPLPRGVVESMCWSPMGDRLACDVHGPDKPLDVWTLSVDAGQVQRVTHSSPAGIGAHTFVEPRLVHYPSFDDLDIPAWLYLPRGGTPGKQTPVVVYVHGGPESQTRPGFSAVYQYFLHRGYAILAPNVRGSTGYGKTWSHLDDVRRRLDAVSDLEYGARWLQESGYVDPRRIAVVGASYGGFMVLSTLARQPELWAAGVDIMGIANFETFLLNTAPWRRRLREVEYGSLEHDLDFLREISPLYHAHRIQAPLMVIHGANDPRVPVGEAEQIVGAVRRRGLPVEYLRFEDEGHGLVKLPNRVRAYSAVGDFLDRHLGCGG